MWDVLMLYILKLKIFFFFLGGGVMQRVPFICSLSHRDLKALLCHDKNHVWAVRSQVQARPFSPNADGGEGRKLFMFRTRLLEVAGVQLVACLWFVDVTHKHTHTHTLPNMW